MKTYKVIARSIHYMTAEVKAENEDKAWEIAAEMDALLFNAVFDKNSCCDWDIYSVDEILPLPRSLTAEELAFVDAYLSAVAVAEREDVVRFLRADSEERSSREFYDSMSDVYTSICDAKEVWYAAMEFAKEDKK
jgi:hypothetical protein